MARVPDGPAPPPAVQRVRLRYAKRGRLRFSSHRDFQRALERALRRTRTPVAYSAGFSPHPKISYAGTVPTGAASEAEYLELALARRCDPAELAAALDAALPAGLDVLEAVEAGPGSLVERLQASLWQIELPGVAPADAQAAAECFLAAERVTVQRLMKSGPRTFDARVAVVTLAVAGSGEENVTVCAAQGVVGSYAIMRLVVRHTTPVVRPDDVLAGLRSQAHLAPPSPPRMTRLAQGPLDEEHGTVADPLTADRNVVGA